MIDRHGLFIVVALLLFAGPNVSAQEQQVPPPDDPAGEPKPAAQSGYWYARYRIVGVVCEYKSCHAEFVVMHESRSGAISAANSFFSNWKLNNCGNCICSPLSIVREYLVYDPPTPENPGEYACDYGAAVTCVCQKPCRPVVRRRRWCAPKRRLRWRACRRR